LRRPAFQGELTLNRESHPGPVRDSPVYSVAMTLGSRTRTLLTATVSIGLIAALCAGPLSAGPFSAGPLSAGPLVALALGQSRAGGPRVSQETGFTRVVLETDAAPVVQNVTLEGRGLRLTLHGVLGDMALEGAPDTSELIAWRLEPNGDRGTLSLKTTFPLDPGVGYRVFVLPAGDGLRDRLVVDLGPEIGPQSATETSGAQSVPTITATAAQPARHPNKPSSSQPASSQPISNQPTSGKPVSRPADRPTVTLTSARIPPKRVPTVVIDPGHGGMDPGMSGFVREKIVTLSVSLKLRALLQNAGIKVVMSRTGDYAWQGRGCNKACDLKKRADLASTDRNVFVSVHVNSGGGYGIETFVFGEPLGNEALRQAERENGGGAIGRELTRQARETARSLVNDQLAQDNLRLSSTLAYSVQRNLIAQSGSRSLGVKRNSLAVLRRARIPAILAEVGFGDHTIEGKNLASSAYQNKLALGLSKGIRAFLGY
jgi:N-acetylmuramoyl-L-alanine amidase